MRTHAKLRIVLLTLFVTSSGTFALAQSAADNFTKGTEAFRKRRSGRTRSSKFV
jgi:hypothetical protein